MSFTVLKSDPVWLRVAAAEIGVHETAGPGSTPRVMEYLRAAATKPDDSIPWCSAFVNWVFASLGMDHTKSAAARSWLKWGTALKEPIRGCVVISWRGNHDDGSSGHVAFYIGEHGDTITTLGGNQSDAVTATGGVARSRVLGYRWPSGAPRPSSGIMSSSIGSAGILGWVVASSIISTLIYYLRRYGPQTT